MKMVSSISGIFSKFSDYLSPSEVPIKGAGISLVVYGVKEFFKVIVFKCPDKYWNIYGSFFLFGHAAILFSFSMMVSDSFWTAMTCCCHRMIRSKLRLTCWKARKAIFLAGLVPLSWLVIAFLDTKFYVCATLGPEDTALSKANETKAKEEIKEKFKEAVSYSEMVAWGLLFSLVTLAIVLITIMRLLRKLDPKIMGEDDLDEKEADEAVKIFHERVESLVMKNAKDVVGDVLKDAESGNIESIIHKGITALTELYPAHGGKMNGLYKAKPTESRWNQEVDHELHCITSP